MDIYVFAGPNGSGKSALASYYLDGKDLPYICADPLFTQYRRMKRYQKMSDKELYVLCMNESAQLCDDNLRDRVDFSFETVFSTDRKFNFLQRAKSAGYTIHAIYTTTWNPVINIIRIKKRVQSGGHGVPIFKTIKRYFKSHNNLQYLMQFADTISVYDNSRNNKKPVLVYAHDERTVYFNNDYKDSWWARRYVCPFMHEQFAIR